MLGSRIEELLASEMEANGGFAVITDEAKQRQLLLDDEEEDFMDEGNFWDNFLGQFFKKISGTILGTTYETILGTTKGQLNSEWIYEVIISPKMPTKNLKDFCLRSLLEDRVEILQIFGWNFGRNDDLTNLYYVVIPCTVFAKACRQKE